MRVVQVCHRYPPSVGGVETHVEAVATRLADRGHESVVVTGDARSGLRLEEERDGVEVIRLRTGPGHVSPAHFIMLDGMEYDALHCHNAHAGPGVLAGLSGPNGRLVFTPHYHGRTSPAPWRWLAARAVRAADEVVAVSGHEAGLLRDHIGAEPRVVPNGLDYPVTRPGPYPGLERPYVLSVGTDGRKRPGRVLDAARLLDMDAVFAGGGPRVPDLENRAELLSMAGRVHFLGKVSDDALAALYEGARCLVNLSTEEAFGMTVGEALARGTPCVVEGSGGLSRWEGTEGVRCVDGSEPAEVAEAVSRSVSASPDERPVPDWDEVVDELINEVYT
jgi:glycosyltransferase involved in cell wall biosynthesis